MRVGPAIAVDVICVLVFAIVGRSSHGEGNDVLGVARTAWPFLVGVLVGAVAGRIWRRPASIPSGLAVWLGALIVGMVLRFLTGGGVPLAFVLVTAAVLAALLLGWRAARSVILSRKKGELTA